MPLINPDEIIKTNFKILNKRKRSHERDAKKVPPILEPGDIPLPLPPSGQDPTAPTKDEIPFEEILLRRVSTFSMSLTKGSESKSYSHGDDSSNASVYVIEERPKKVENVDINDNGILNAPKPVIAAGESTDKDSKRSTKRHPANSAELGIKRKARRFAKRKLIDDDSRRDTWIPCSCPQYKVSKDLATKYDLQGLFFGKILVVKVVQLLVINLVVLSSVFESGRTLPFFKRKNDWAYWAVGVFLALLLCIRWGVGYRSRWPIATSIIILIPLTMVIAFACACVATIHNTLLIPLVTCTIFLTFIMLFSVPYLLRKSVIHGSTNLAGCGLVFLNSIALVFLKEFEMKGMTYWEFVSNIWLPGMVLSQLAVQITVCEIQRIIFGLCFNVSTKRWHVAALYV